MKNEFPCRKFAAGQTEDACFWCEWSERSHPTHDALRDPGVFETIYWETMFSITPDQD